MNKRLLTALSAIVLTMSMLLAACTSGGKGVNNQEVAEPSGGPNGGTPEGGKETAGSETDTSEQKYTINLFSFGWVNTPLANDPWKAWADKRYNVDFKLTAIPGSELEQKLLVSFASKEHPDLIFVGDKTIVEKLYKQGVLLDDYTPYLDKLPTLSKYFNEGTKTYTTRDGKMIMLPLAPNKNRWTVHIRKDWLANLGMKEPTTDEELFEYLKVVTFNDPDGNKKNDTFGTTSAGTGKNLNLFSNFELMYGPSGWYVEDGKVNHSLLDGTHRKMLDFVKRLVDEKVVDPDWYLQDWGKMGTKVHGSKAGMIWYPSRELINEEAGGKSDDSYLEFWEPIAVPKGSERGGKLGPDAIAGGVYAISAAAAKDPGKLERILRILDDAQYPNEGYLGFRWGVGVPGVDQKIQKTESGQTFINMKDDFRAQQGNEAGYDYGAWVLFNGTDPVLEISEESPGKLTLTWAAAEEKVQGFEKLKNYNDLLNLDATTVSNLQKLQDEFDIKYILGKNTDYDQFAQTWLKNGGQKLIDDATEQFKALGLVQ